MTAIWSFPTRIVFGTGEAARAGEEALTAGIGRALIVTDAGVLAAGLCEPVRASLERLQIPTAIYSGIQSNPTEQDVAGGAAAFRDHHADGIVAIGGGSPIDSAKLIAVRVRTNVTWEELDDARAGGKHVPRDVPPVIALPTTAGTGSEVGRAAVLTVESTGKKTVVFSPYLLPKVAILDPELTASMPAKTTAATGFDALTHCIEAYLSLGDHPMADAIALAGIDLVVANLKQAVADGGDLEVRGNMMKAAMMGAVAFQKGLGACHSLAHPLSSDCGLHHGLANALCLPAVLDFNEQAATDRVLHIALLIGAEPELGAAGAAIRELRRGVGLPEGLAAVGIRPEKLSVLAAKALQDACHRENPRPCTQEDLLTLYQASM
jgi:4-hydroxybutyrate dehydrogenase